MDRIPMRAIVRALVLDGPGLDLLGTRESAPCSSVGLVDVEKLCHRTAAAHGLEADPRQSSHEGCLVDVVLTGTHLRGESRHRGYVAGAADAVICGAGPGGDVRALTSHAGLLGGASR
ncbi:type II 3-dehydroquinate dehydratase [Streptomyces sp. NPDC058221]|uniref:type II 3-dehydroquinate dehydratase n=1 Tax=Streptomyces sp. NPDC058221 TaxID=3346388 RepID=UPI0036F04D4D